MTHKHKRLFVRLRLTQADAASMSDRALARELGVSQPFVGAQRRSFGPPQATVVDAGLAPSSVLERTFNASQDGRDPLDRQWNPSVQRDEVRSPRAPFAPGRALCDGDPFA